MMSLPDFELGPLEIQQVAANEPAVAPALARVQVDGEDILLRLCSGKRSKPLLFMRLNYHNSPVLSFESSLPPYIPAQPWSQGDYEIHQPFGSLHLERDEEQLLSLVKYLLNEGQFERSLSFPSRVPHHLMSLRLRRGGCVWSKSLTSGGSTSFELSHFTNDEYGMGWVMHVTDDELLHLVGEDINDETSDCYSSWNWIQLDWHAQMRFVAQFVRGNYDGFLKVLHYISYLIGLGNVSQNTVEWFIHLAGHTQDEARERARPARFYDLISHTHESPQTIEWLEKWLDVIYAYFLPYYDANLERYSIIRHISRVSDFEIYCDVPVSTSHERLESRLYLRDWLQGKVPPEEISVLMGATE